MRLPRFATAALAAAILNAALGVAAAGADAPPRIADLVAPPPAQDWTLFPPDTGNLTANILWGAQASSIRGFTDAYRMVWTGPDGQILTEVVEQFDSAFWAGFRQGSSRSAARNNAKHLTFTDAGGLGQSAYETTDAPNANGYAHDTVVFTRGDYLAVFTLASKGTSDHDLLMGQARSEYGLLPYPRNEYQQIGYVILGGGLAAVLVVVGVVALAIHTGQRRRPRPAPIAGLSPDRRYWWDGSGWQDTLRSAPVGARRSADGTQWWDGVSWRPVPQAPRLEA